MRIQNLMPKAFRRMKPNEKLVTVALGAVATAGVVYFFNRKAVATPMAPASRISVQGVWTDLATKLGMPIGADMDVKTAQRYLNQVGHAGLAEDGILGKATKAALLRFQKSNGLPESGIIDEETGNALQYLTAASSKNVLIQKQATATPALISSLKAPAGGYWHDRAAASPGLGKPFTESVKMSIKGAQRALNDITHSNLVLTGQLDQGTVAALTNFQAEQGLPATGQLDPETSNALMVIAATVNPTMKQKPVAYSPYPMPQQPVTYSPYPMPPLSAVSGQSTLMYDPRDQYGF
jgi:peptidoglycan hydrolase-like protein with peptidoglycan-binding domain